MYSRIIKRLWSAILATFMLAAMIPGTMLAAGEHSHVICGSICADPNHDDAHTDPIVWTAWEDDDSLPNAAGNYYLNTNVTITAEWAVSANITIDLNGHNITLDADAAALSHAISVANGAVFTLTDCQGSGVVSDGNGTSLGTIGIATGGTFNMYEGLVLGNYSYHGSAVYQAEAGTFNMYGGSYGGTWGGIDWNFTVKDSSGNGKLTISATTADPTTLAERWSYPPTWSGETLPDTYRVGEWPAATNPSVTEYHWPYNAHRAKITDIEIKEGVITCGTWTCLDFTGFSGKLTIPSTVEYIGTETFAKCYATELEFAEGSQLKCLAPGAFKYLKIKNLELPEGLKCIHIWAFLGCDQLEHATIPASVETVIGRTHEDWDPDKNVWGESSIFAYCYAIKTITFKDEADMLQYLSIANYGTYNRDELAAFNGTVFYSSLQEALDAAEAGGITEVSLRKSITTTGEIVIPENVTLDLNGKTLTNKGELVNLGTIEGNGSVVLNTGSTYAASEDAVGPNSLTPSELAYILSCDLDGGEVTPANPRHYLKSSEDITLTSPTKTGYIFTGWTGTDLDGPTFTVTIPSGSTGDLAFTANWEPITYDISFDANGGKGEMEDITGVIYDESIVLPANTFTKSGYILAGWNTKADGTGTDYNDEATVKNLTDEAEDTVILYAIWEINPDMPVFDLPTAAVNAPAGMFVEPHRPAAGDMVTVTVPEGMKADGIKVKDENGDPVRVNGKGGVYTFIMPEGAVEISELINPFTDIDKSSYYYDAALWAYANDITSGTTESTFSPDASCTRAQVMTFLWRAAGCPEPEADITAFTDVSEDDYYFKAVLWAVENGITFGTGENTFSPADSCTLAQVMAFLYRAQDSGAGNDLSDAVLWAVQNGLTNGAAEDDFSPNEICSRGQIVTFLFRCYSK